MARFNYNRLAKRADKIMRRFGLANGRGFLERGGERRAVVAVEANFSPRERDGALVQMDDTRYLVSSYQETVPPEAEVDTFVWVHPVTLAETVYRVLGAQRTAPGGENVFWQLHCRAL